MLDHLTLYFNYSQFVVVFVSPTKTPHFKTLCFYVGLLNIHLPMAKSKKISSNYKVRLAVSQEAGLSYFYLCKG